MMKKRRILGYNLIGVEPNEHFKCYQWLWIVDIELNLTENV